MTDMHREAFERWIGEEGEHPERLRLDYKDDYASYSTYAQWQVWCAAIRHLTEQNEQKDSHE